MMTLPWTGAVLAALLGLAHAAYVYRAVSSQVSGDTAPNHTRALYFALWTLALWVLLGSYILILWLIGLVLYVIFKALQ